MSAGAPSGAATRRAPMVTGVEKLWVKLRIWARIVWLARRQHPGWGAALAALQRLRAYRRRYRGGAVTRKYVRAGGRHFWDLYAPGFPSRAFDHYVSRELERVVEPARPLAPPTVVLALTRRCPLACEHCCEWDTLNQPDPVSVPDWARIAAGFHALGSSQFFLSGGEPLARLPAVFAVLEQVARTADVWLLSSGVGLGPRRARELRRAGLTGVVLSVDHWERQAHDAFRGRAGTFDAVVAAAAAAHAAGLAVGMALVPTRAFLDSDALERYRHLAVELGAGFLQLLEPKPVGRYARSEVGLDAEHQRRLEAFARETSFERQHAAAPIVAHPDATRRASGCQGASRYAYVDTRGVLHSCPFCRSGSALLLAGTEQGVAVSEALGALRLQGCGLRSTAMNHPQAGEAHERPRTSLPVL
jgi:MoaA/NifB/PqqE/SkfB family radical SAM enzyme